VIDRRWPTLRYPSYWHYDVLQALLILSRLGKARDPRSADPLDLLVRRRRADGSVAVGRVLVAPTRHHPPRVVPAQGGRLGAVGPERDAHPQCPAGAAHRRLVGTLALTLA
jgi:hypothetical protein